MKILYKFFSGTDIHTTEYDAQEPLKDYIPRIEQLLGVKMK